MSDQPPAQGPTTSNGTRLVVRTALRSDVGKVRTENQDFAILSRTPSKTKGLLMVVADGMGGHRGGATASRMAASTIESAYLEASDPDISRALHEALSAANARIFSEAQLNPDLRGMGTTCSTLVILGDQAHLAHVGDSRIYLVRDGQIRQLTDDHSLVASMVREGLLTSKEAEVHPRRNILQRSMGVAPDLEIDTPAPFQILAGDTFILCSDGLYGLVKENELQEIASGEVEQAAEEYVRMAISRGAPDNVTVIVARVEVGEETEDAATEPPQSEVATIEAVSPADIQATPTQPVPIPKPEPPKEPAIRIRVEAPPRKTLLRWIFIALVSAGVAGVALIAWAYTPRS